MNIACSAVGSPAQHFCLHVTPHFCLCTLRIKWSGEEENSPWLWAQKSAHCVKHIKQHILQKTTKFVLRNIMEFKSWRYTKFNWIQPHATWFEFEVNLALQTGLETSKTFQIKWFYGCSCQLPPTAPISDTTYTKKCADRQPFTCSTSPAYLHWICYPINWIYEREKKFSHLWGARRGGKPPRVNKPLPTWRKQAVTTTVWILAALGKVVILPGNLHLSYLPHSSRCLTLLGGQVCCVQDLDPGLWY